MQIVQGLRVCEGLTALSASLVIIASQYGFTKEQAIAAFSANWDSYEERHRELLH